MIVRTNENLKDVCQRFATASFITIDTEFVREWTFYPKVCLIQIASENEAVAIDPLAEGIDLTPLYELLRNKNILKVFHAGRQDIEIFYHLTKEIPYPIFDTQVGAMVCGFGDSVSYQQLVSQLLKVELDKGMRVTDWSKRPLSDAQINYALSDVTYLRDVYKKMIEEVKSLNRLSWIEEEIETLYDKETYAPSDEKICQKLKYNFKSEKMCHLYQELYLLRERRAKKLNMPRRQVLKDDLLHDLVNAHPKSIDDFNVLRSVPSSIFKNGLANEIVDCVKYVYKTPNEKLRPFLKEKKLSGVDKNLVAILHLLLEMISTKEKTAQKLIATQEDLTNFILGKSEIKFLTGWRYNIFGKQAILLRDGKLFIGYDSKKRKIIFNEIAEN